MPRPDLTAAPPEELLIALGEVIEDVVEDLAASTIAPETEPEAPEAVTVTSESGFGEITVVPEGAAEVELPEAGMNIDEAFIHAVRTGDRSVIRTDYFDALKTTEVTLGANESAISGQPVEMKLG